MPPHLRRTSSAIFEPVTQASLDGATAPPSPSAAAVHSALPDLATVAVASALDDESFASSCVISGGTGGNAICHAFKEAAFVLPISDDGGSSSEILRCLGGPSIGDIRSRLIRLAPTPDDAADEPTGEPPSRYDEALGPIIRLLSHRLPADASEAEAKSLWRQVVEGTSPLWSGIPADRREVLHRFFIIFEGETLQRAHKGFSFINCSLGNVFLASAQRFFLSLPAAIFLFSSITGIPTTGRKGTVLPAILTNRTATIAAELESGETIVGQCNISHPAREYEQEPEPLSPVHLATSAGCSDPNSPSSAVRSGGGAAFPGSGVASFSALPTRSGTPSSFGGEDGIDSGRGKSKLPAFKLGGRGVGLEAVGGGGPKNLIFKRTGQNAGDDDDETPLDSRIRRLYYINSYGQEIFPLPNPEVLQALAEKEVLVYSCGSLYTSLAPCLALSGMASAIRSSRSLRAKVLLLNPTNDRETHGYSAVDYVHAIAQTLNRYDTSSSAPTRKGSISSTFSMTSPADVMRQAASAIPLRIAHGHLITHVVCIEGCQVEVDEEAIKSLGIRVIWISPTAGLERWVDENAEALVDGWFRTGDTSQWNSDGTLSLIDRIKNLVKLSSGEYIALEKLESTYKGANILSNLAVYANSDASKPIGITTRREGERMHIRTWG